MLALSCLKGWALAQALEWMRYGCLGGYFARFTRRNRVAKIMMLPTSFRHSPCRR